MNQELKKFRKQIDKIDQKIINLLENRFLISQKIAEFKKNSKIKNSLREQEILNNWHSKIKISSIEFTNKIVNLILKESRRIQKNYKKNL